MDLDPSSSSSSSSNPKSATENASGIWDSYHSQKTRTPAGEERKDLVTSQLSIKNLSENFQRQMPRRWQDGEVYAPHDLSEVEARKWKKVTNVQRDLVDMLGLRPVDMYSVSALPPALEVTNLALARRPSLGASARGGDAGTKSPGLIFADTGLCLPQNFSVVSEFITPHGRIKKRSITGLKPKNQRKVAKMVRRAVGLGIHPSVHRHPELLMREGQMSQAQTSATQFKGSYI